MSNYLTSRFSYLLLAFGLLALVALNVAFYPSIRGDTTINDYVKDLPESLRSLFAGGELDIASPAGYLNSQVFALMAPLITDKKSIAAKVPDERNTTWVKPKLVAEVKFTEWTSAGEMRHPVFLGLRTDKKATEVVRELPKA